MDLMYLKVFLFFCWVAVVVIILAVKRVILDRKVKALEERVNKLEGRG